MKARFLGFLAAFVTVSTWAQGTIYFATRIANGVNAPLEFGTGFGPGPSWSAALYLVDSQNSLSLIPGFADQVWRWNLQPAFSQIHRTGDS